MSHTWTELDCYQDEHDQVISTWRCSKCGMLSNTYGNEPEPDKTELRLMGSLRLTCDELMIYRVMDE